MKRKYIFLAIIPVALIAAWFIYQSTIFRMTGTTPGLNRVSSISPFIDVNFSKDIEPESVNILIDTIDVTSFEVINKKTIRVFIGDMSTEANYSFKIERVSSKKGKELRDITISFTAKDIPFEKLSKAQKDAILKNQDRTDNTKSDEILSYLPYGGLHFKLNANQVNDRLILEAEILLSKADLGANKEARIENYKNEVVDFIESKDLNPKDYTIEYKIIEPSIY